MAQKTLLPGYISLVLEYQLVNPRFRNRTLVKHRSVFIQVMLLHYPLFQQKDWNSVWLVQAGTSLSTSEIRARCLFEMDRELRCVLFDGKQTFRAGSGLRNQVHSS